MWGDQKDGGWNRTQKQDVLSEREPYTEREIAKEKGYKRAIEDECHFILECDRYTDIRCKYIYKKYYYRNPSTFKLIQLL